MTDARWYTRLMLANCEANLNVCWSPYPTATQLFTHTFPHHFQPTKPTLTTFTLTEAVAVMFLMRSFRFYAPSFVFVHLSDLSSSSSGQRSGDTNHTSPQMNSPLRYLEIRSTKQDQCKGPPLFPTCGVDLSTVTAARVLLQEQVMSSSRMLSTDLGL